MTGRTLGFIAAFLIPVVLARVLDQSEFGTYKQLFLIYSTLYCIAQLGMAESLFYFLPAASQQGGRYVGNAMLIAGVAGVAALIVLWTQRAPIAAALNNTGLANYLPWIGAYLLLMLMSAVLEIVMTARKAYRKASASYAITDLGRAVLLVAPVLWLGHLEGLLLGAVIFAAWRLAATVWYLAAEYRSGLGVNASLVRVQWAYAMPFSIYVLIEVLQSNLHWYAVSSRFDAAAFAVYAVGCLTIPLVEFLTSSAGNVMMVRMREHLLNENLAAVAAIWRDTTRKLILIFAPLVAVLWVIAQEMILILFTERYAASVPVFMVWVITILLAAFLTDSVLRVFSQIRFLMLLGLIKLMVVSVTIFPLMHTFGILGAALSVLIGLSVGKMAALVQIKRVMRSSLAALLPWASLGIIVTMAVTAAIPAYFLKLAVSGPMALQATVGVLAYFVTYLSLIWSFNQISAAEKRSLIHWLSHRKAIKRQCAGASPD